MFIFLPINIIIIGKATNDKINEIVIPILIIKPKFITGSMLDKINEANPTTVVIIAKMKVLILIKLYL